MFTFFLGSQSDLAGRPVGFPPVRFPDRLKPPTAVSALYLLRFALRGTRRETVLLRSAFRLLPVEHNYDSISATRLQAEI